MRLFTEPLSVGVKCYIRISLLSSLFFLSPGLQAGVFEVASVPVVLNDQYKFTQSSVTPVVIDPFFDYTDYQLHQVFVHTVNETDYIKRIFGDADYPAGVHAPNGIYNNYFCAGPTSGGVPPPNFMIGTSNAFEFDSWVGIGLTYFPDYVLGEEDVLIDETASNPWSNHFTLSFESSGNYGALDIFMDDAESQGGWYLDSDDATNGYAGDDHKAIVMQLMTTGTFTWTLNAEIWIDGDPDNAIIVSQTYNGTSLESPVILGCTSPTACNFDSFANTDDGTCEFPEEYYDCDGACLIDLDGDGVCDELEIVGCQDDAACNYMEAATDAGECDYPEGCESCSGATDGTGYAIDNDQDDDGICDGVDPCIGAYDAFGVCNGDGTIQGALDNSLAGDTISIPAGAYIEALVITHSIYLIAEGEVLLDVSGSTTGVAIEAGVSNVLIDGLDITGNSLTGSGITINPGCANVEIRDNSISQILLPGGGNQSPLSYGILCWGDSNPIAPPSGIVIVNNTIESVLGSAISLGSNSESVEIRDNSFNNIIPVDYFGSPLAIGIQAELANNLEIFGNSYSNLLQSNSLVNCTNVSIQQNTYENSSLMLLTTFPHDAEFLDAPWWSSALSLGGSELYEVFVNTPMDPTYLLGLSQGISDSSSNPGCMNPAACNFDSEALSDDGSCIIPTGCELCSGETDGTGTILDVDNDVDADGICDQDDNCTDTSACNYDDPINSACQVNDECGVCGGTGIPADYCDCNGNQNDALGICGGACLADVDADGICDDADNCTDTTACNYDSPTNEACQVIDECGVCGGTGIPAEYCDCDGNQNDALGVCGGSCLADADGDGVCDDVDDCVGSYDALNVCNGTCEADVDADGICDDADNCTDTTACNYDSPTNEACQVIDECGVCGGTGIPAEYCDCDGNQNDALGVCGGSCLADADGDGVCDDVDDCVGSYDALNVCNGTCEADADADGICDDADNCTDTTACNYDSPTNEACQVIDECGVCGGTGIPAEYCDCDGNQNDALGVCGGSCLADADGDGICDDADNCTDTTACNFDDPVNGACQVIDECGVCGGTGIPLGDCDCNGNQNDALGVCGGSCLADADGDGVCDDVDDCVGSYDALNVCNGTCEADVDEDGICDTDEVVGCQDPAACNFDSLATDPGTCFIAATYFDCSGNCLNDSDGNGICDEIDALLLDEFTQGVQFGVAQCIGDDFCGEGTVWSEAFQMCVEDSSCPGDLNGDLVVGTGDLLLLLMDYGFGCE